VFNSQNKRAVDGMMGQTLKKSKQTKAKANSKTTNQGPKGKKEKWRRDHEELVKAIKMSRLIKKVQEAGGDITKIPVAPSAPNEDFIECQY
jgi:hypothetical protein